MLEGAVLPLGRLRSVRAAGGWGEGLIPNSTAYARPQAISTAAGRLPASYSAGNGGYGARQGLSSGGRGGGGLWVQVVVRSKDEMEGTAVVALQVSNGRLGWGGGQDQGMDGLVDPAIAGRC